MSLQPIDRPNDFVDTYPCTHADTPKDPAAPTHPLDELIGYTSGFRWGVACGYLAGLLTGGVSTLAIVALQTPAGR